MAGISCCLRACKAQIQNHGRVGNDDHLGNGTSVQILTECRERISKKQVLRPLAEKRGLDTWEKIVNFTKDEWFASRFSFGKFKGRHFW